MVTTIQVNERTLMLLKKLKQEFNAKSYESALNQVVIERAHSGKSMAGSLKKYCKEGTLKRMLKELQNDRRESNRF